MLIIRHSYDSSISFIQFENMRNSNNVIQFSLKNTHQIVHSTAYWFQCCISIYLYTNNSLCIFIKCKCKCKLHAICFWIDRKFIHLPAKPNEQIHIFPYFFLLLLLLLFFSFNFNCNCSFCSLENWVCKQQHVAQRNRSTEKVFSVKTLCYDLISIDDSTSLIHNYD